MDVVFIDPPYCREMIPEAIKIIKENNMLSEDGIIVTKIDSIEEIYEGYEDIKLFKSKKYGNTTIIVTHNDAIKDMADRVIYLHDGRIRENIKNTHKIPAKDLNW